MMGTFFGLIRNMLSITVIIFMIVSSPRTAAAGRAPQFRWPILSERIAFLNNNLELLCMVKGNPKPRVVWYHNDSLLQANERIKMGRNAVSIKHIKLQDAGYYRCQAKNNYGEIWGNITVTLLKRDTNKCDTFVKVTGSAVIEEGKQIKLTCSVTGKHLEVDWFFNGKKILMSDPKWNKRVHISKMLSEQSLISTLTINQSEHGDIGSYTCRKSYLFLDSLHVNVINGTVPRFRRPILSNRITFVNHRIELFCKVKGRPSPSIVWYHNASVMQLSERVEFGRYSIKIKNVRREDAGTYNCKAYNEFGERWGNFSVEVYNDNESVNLEDDMKPQTNACSSDYFKGEPNWSKKKDGATLLVKPYKHMIEIDCSAKGYPRPNITWYKNEKLIRARPGKYMEEGWTLTIYDLTMKDEAEYTCVVQNECGSIEWTYTLEVVQRILTAPIIDGMDNVTVVEGEDAVFTCKILMSDSQPLLQWLKHYKVNGSYVDKNDKPYYETLEQSGMLKKVDDPHYLTIRNTTEEDEGWYTCLVANSVGVNYRSGWLTVLST